MGVITKQLAVEIAKKLKAEVQTKSNRPHDLCIVKYGGRIIATFGICRGSNKDKGHDHIPGQIGLKKRDAKLFAQCNYTYEHWVQEMKDKGKIVEPSEPQQAK